MTIRLRAEALVLAILESQSLRGRCIDIAEEALRGEVERCAEIADAENPPGVLGESDVFFGGRMAAKRIAAAIRASP